MRRRATDDRVDQRDQRRVCSVAIATNSGDANYIRITATVTGPIADDDVTMCGGRPATLFGTAGDDVLTGRARRDVVVAFGGNDTIRGGLNNDTICGGAGADRIRGGAGDDSISGGAGNDTLVGDAGNDTLNSRDGRRETVSCGTGRQDRVIADRIDRLVACEIVRRG